MEKNNFLNNIFSNKWNPFVIIIGIGFLLYLKSIFFDFTYLDDNNLILENQYFLSNIANIYNSFFIDVFNSVNTSAFYYRPLLTISFILDYQIGGLSPIIYHFTNLIIHITSACLVFIFLTKLNYKKTISFLFSLIFLIHPVLTQAVSWVPGRNDSLLALFVLSSFIFFKKYLDDEKTKNLILSLIFFALGIFTKESGLFLLFIFFIYLLFIYRDFKKLKKFDFNKYYFLIGLTAISFVWAIMRHFVIKNTPQAPLIDMIKSVYLNIPAVLQYIGKIFLPFNLSVLPIIQDTVFIYGIISLLFLIVLIFFTKNRRWGYILFGIGWFFVFLLPSFIRPNPLLPADFIQHRLYVPIIGIFIILLETDLFKKINFKKKNHLIIIFILLCIFTVINVINNKSFSNRFSFWENATKNSPDYPLAHRNLGAMQYLNGDFDNAEIEFKKALELNPKEKMAHNNLGLIYASQNKLASAEDEYKKELEINPNYDNTYYNLGLLYFKEGKYKQAEDSWQTTLMINPNYTDAIKSLALYYYRQNDYNQLLPYANELYKRGYELPPEILKVLQNYINN